MTAIRLDDTPRARGGGRLRPPPRWHRWSIVELRRRRALAALEELRRDAADDDAVLAVLDGPIAALRALVAEPEPTPSPPRLGPPPPTVRRVVPPEPAREPEPTPAEPASLTLGDVLALAAEPDPSAPARKDDRDGQHNPDL